MGCRGGLRGRGGLGGRGFDYGRGTPPAACAGGVCVVAALSAGGPEATRAVAASSWRWRPRQAYGAARDGSHARPRLAWSRVWGPSRVPQGHDEADARMGAGRAGWRRRAANAWPRFVFL